MLGSMQPHAAHGGGTSTRRYQGTPAHGICFKSPSSSSAPTSANNSSSTGSESSCNSKDSGQQAPRNAAAPGTAALLCSSPSIESPLLAGQEPSHHMQLAEEDQDDRAASGMNSHQLDISCKPTFVLPSLHSMLGSSADASKQYVGCTPAAATATTPADRQPTAAPPGGSTSSTHNRHTACDGVASSPAASSDHDALLAAAQDFLQACATPGAVAALAMLAHNQLLPVQPVTPIQPTSSNTGEHRPARCCATVHCCGWTHLPRV